MSLELKTSAEWLKTDKWSGYTVMDPDGWDRKNFKESWEEKISEKEFERRISVSTVTISIAGLSKMHSKYP